MLVKVLLSLQITFPPTLSLLQKQAHKTVMDTEISAVFYLLDRHKAMQWYKIRESKSLHVGMTQKRKGAPLTL